MKTEDKIYQVEWAVPDYFNGSFTMNTKSVFCRSESSAKIYKSKLKESISILNLYNIEIKIIESVVKD